MNNSLIGITDLPRSEEDPDLLNTDAYAMGLSKFILSCVTPMSVALQGDWGSGKSSFLNHIEKVLKKEPKIKTLTINTWQYSQISTDDNLPQIFMMSLLEGLGMDQKGKIAKKFFRGAIQMGRIAFKAVGGDASAFDDAFVEESVGRVAEIKELRDTFQAYVEESLKPPHCDNAPDDARLVILVDDLDRLNPKVAVELLETIKLFMDVKKCVFVLAIDYDIVVQGVKDKYGNHITNDKCRSFFDKIIQLPFHMPVETYKLDGMVKEYLGDKIKDAHIKQISNFAELVIRANPRALKRLVNSFLLLDIIQMNLEKDLSISYTEKENAILLCILCIQIRYPILYNYLADFEEWQEKGRLVGKVNSDDSSASYEEIYYRLSKYDEELDHKYARPAYRILLELEGVLESIYGKNDQGRYDKLRDIIGLSTVTEQSGADGSVFEVRKRGQIAQQHVYSVVEKVLETPNFNKGTLSKAFKDVAAKFEVNESTVRDKCTRKLGLNTDEFYSALRGFADGTDDTLLNRLAPEDAEKLKGLVPLTDGGSEDE